MVYLCLIYNSGGIKNKLSTQKNKEIETATVLMFTMYSVWQTKHNVTMSQYCLQCKQEVLPPIMIMFVVFITSQDFQ